MADDPQAQGEGFGTYRILSPIAVGGMAEVCLATRSSLAGFEKTVVIKRILPRLADDERFVGMFLDEARIAARLNHANVIQVFELGQIDGRYFIAMEYLDGESLGAVLATCLTRHVPLPSDLAAGIVMQAAEGLHHAHTRCAADGSSLHIIHRDVSPQNVIVLYEGGVKVVDFGVAKASTSQTKTRTGMTKGKAAYMAPEQIRGEPMDGRADVFSLGIVLWECLTGRRLFRGGNDVQVMVGISEHDAPSVQSVNPDVPSRLDRITRRALEREPALRYPDAATMRHDLASYLREVGAEADTAAIGRFMQRLFADRIERKRTLLSRSPQLPQAELAALSSWRVELPQLPAPDADDAGVTATAPLPTAGSPWRDPSRVWLLGGLLGLGLSTASGLLWYANVRQVPPP